MNVLGGDPSSNVTGLAVVANGKHVYSEAWQPKGHDTGESMRQLMRHTMKLIASFEVDLLVYELVSVQWNVNTIRKIAYFEGALMMAAALKAVPAKPCRATQARKIVAGKGNMSKEAAFRWVHDAWFPQNSPSKVIPATMDETDALILALAGPSLP